MREKILNVMDRNGWHISDITYYDMSGGIFANLGKYNVEIKRYGLTSMFKVKINDKVENMSFNELIDWVVDKAQEE